MEVAKFRELREVSREHDRLSERWSLENLLEIIGSIVEPHISSRYCSVAEWQTWNDLGWQWAKQLGPGGRER